MEDIHVFVVRLILTSGYLLGIGSLIVPALIHYEEGEKYYGNEGDLAQTRTQYDFLTAFVIALWPVFVLYKILRHLIFKKD